MLEADHRFLRNRNHYCNSCTHWFISDIFNILIKSKVFRLTKTLFFKIWLRCDIFLSSKTRKRFILVRKVKHGRTFRPRLGFVIVKLTQNHICGEDKKKSKIDSFSKISLLGSRNYDLYLVFPRAEGASSKLTLWQ